MKIVLVSGGFDPLHSGHIDYLKSARALGDYLVVGLNSDKWLARKKGKHFMPLTERAAIIKELKCVDEVFPFDESHDADGTCVKFILDVLFRESDSEIIFANGGDRTSENIPEMSIESPRLSFAFGVGGEDKKNSSSWILKDWQYPREDRVWGEFSNLFQDDAVKVKELIIQPGKGISLQRHFKRSEIWFVSKGSCTVKYGTSSDPHINDEYQLETDQVFIVKQGAWHQIINNHTVPCHMIEIQYGPETSESDIERAEYYTPQTGEQGE